MKKPLRAYYDARDPTFMKYVAQTQRILQEEKALQEIVQLVGKDSLDEEQKVSLEVAKLIREDFLMQNSFTEFDFTCPPYKTSGMIRNFCKFYELSQAAVSQEQEHKMTWSRIRNTLKSSYDSLVHMKFISPYDPQDVVEKKLQKTYDDMAKAFNDLQHS